MISMCVRLLLQRADQREQRAGQSTAESKQAGNTQADSLYPTGFGLFLQGHLHVCSKQRGDHEGIVLKFADHELTVALGYPTDDSQALSPTQFP